MKFSPGRLGHNITHEGYNPNVITGNQRVNKLHLNVNNNSNHRVIGIDEFKHRFSGVEEFKGP